MNTHPVITTHKTRDGITLTSELYTKTGGLVTPKKHAMVSQSLTIVDEAHASTVIAHLMSAFNITQYNIDK